jgi:hypothetical protein
MGRAWVFNPIPDSVKLGGVRTSGPEARPFRPDRGWQAECEGGLLISTLRAR